MLVDEDDVHTTTTRTQTVPVQVLVRVPVPAPLPVCVCGGAAVVVATVVVAVVVVTPTSTNISHRHQAAARAGSLDQGGASEQPIPDVCFGWRRTRWVIGLLLSITPTITRPKSFSAVKADGLLQFVCGLLGYCYF